MADNVYRTQGMGQWVLINEDAYKPVLALKYKAL